MSSDCLLSFIRGSDLFYDRLRILENKKFYGIRIFEGRELDYLCSLQRRFAYKTFNSHINQSEAGVSGLDHMLGCLEVVGYRGEA